MGRARRYIVAGKPYELILRVKEGLPFRPGPLINTLLESAMARAQRDNKVTICHYLWMGNHAHIILIPRCPQSCVNFYQELQKKITDYFKRLLGKRRLALWEGDPVLAQILDVDKAIDRIAYLYANPARANLVDSIDEYIGASSWKQFMYGAKPSELPWIRLHNISAIPSLYLSEHQEKILINSFFSKASEFHTLEVDHTALWSSFGIFADIRERVLLRLHSRLQDARLLREISGKKIPTKAQTLKQKIYARHTPKRKPGEKRIFVLTSMRELRISFIKAYKEFCVKCTNCYELLKKGASQISWPKFAFIPYSLATDS